MKNIFAYVLMGSLIIMPALSLAGKNDPEQAAIWSGKVASALCLRTVACGPENSNLTLDACIGAMQPLLTQAFQEKSSPFSDEKIDACVASIGDETCESLSQSVPKNCKFLKGIIDAKTSK